MHLNRGKSAIGIFNRALRQERLVLSLVRLMLALCVVSIFSSSLSATWRLLDNRRVTSMDFLSSGLGLVAIGMPAPHLELWRTSTFVDGVFATNDEITSVIIVDSAHAYCTVKGDGLYYSSDSWQHWQKLAGGSSLRLLYADRSLIEINQGSGLQFSTDGLSLLPTNGILPGDSVTSIDRINSRIFLAAAGAHLYRSIDGGISWSPTRFDQLGTSRSVFVDRTTGDAFAGAGDSVRVSKDSGLTWTAIPGNIFANLAGQVVGTHDCSGVWYLTPNYFRGALLRTESHGSYLQEVGAAAFASINLQKAVVLDRGAAFYWLDQSGYLSYDSTGVDGSIPPSSSTNISITVPSLIVGNLCGKSPTTFAIVFNSPNCDTTILDSIKILRSSGTVIFTRTRATFSNTSPDSIVANFAASRAGSDTLTGRLWVHSKLTGRTSIKDFSVTVTTRSDPPRLAFTTHQVHFSITKLDSTSRSFFFIHNSGCATLTIDSIASSDPGIFSIKKITAPALIKGQDSLRVDVAFHPDASGAYLEALEIGSNGGHDFIELVGQGSSSQSVMALVSDKGVLAYPNPANNELHFTSNGHLLHVKLYDILGRLVIERKNVGSTLNIAALAPGSYVLKLDGSRGQRLLIAR